MIFKQIKNDKQFTLINLLALNCGFYGVDIEFLEKSMIKEKDGLTYISYPRLKTQRTSPRVIILWDKTVKLLKKYMAECPNNTQWIFLNHAKTNLKTKSIQDTFKKLKKKIKHSDGSEINFKNYRDTVTSSLVYKVNNLELVSVTIGHDFTGKKSEYWKYIETKPSEILSVSEILYNKFKSVIDGIRY
jgi:integrase